MDRSNAKCWITEHRFVGQSFAPMTSEEEDALNLEDNGMSLPSIILPSDHHPTWCIMLVFESLDFMLKTLKNHIFPMHCLNISNYCRSPNLIWLVWMWWKHKRDGAPIICLGFDLNWENMKIWVKLAINQISSPKIVPTLSKDFCATRTKFVMFNHCNSPSFHDLVLGLLRSKCSLAWLCLLA